MIRKRYMGDGCFAEITSEGIVLTTENGTNRIVLEPKTWSAVLAFVASAKVELDLVASAKEFGK